MQDLRRALDAWIAAKGAGWRTSTRNSSGAVETLNNQVNEALGPGPPAVTASALQRHRQQLTAPAPTRLPGISLSTDALVRAYCRAVRDNVHTPWARLTADERATAMHRALADLFPLMDNMPAPGLILVGDLGGDAGRFDFTTWNLTVASGPFSGGAPPTRDEFLDAAKTIYHEGRHCEQWFHMARYAASGLSAGEIARTLGIPPHIAADALGKRMDVRDPMFRDARSWFESVYSRSGRARSSCRLLRFGRSATRTNWRPCDAPTTGGTGTTCLRKPTPGARRRCSTPRTSGRKPARISPSSFRHAAAGAAGLRAPPPRPKAAAGEGAFFLARSKSSGYDHRS